MNKFKVGDKVKIKSLAKLIDRKYSFGFFTVTAVDSRFCYLNNKYLYKHTDLVLYIPDNDINRLLYPELKSEEGILV